MSELAVELVVCEPLRAICSLRRLGCEHDGLLMGLDLGGCGLDAARVNDRAEFHTRGVLVDDLENSRLKRLLADAELDYGVSGGRIGKLLSLFIAAANGPARQRCSWL